MGPLPLEASVLDALAAVARESFGRDRLDGSALATEVRRVSDLYNAGGAPGPNDADALQARLRFFLPRDLPKLEGPLGELASVGALPRRDALRVLDLGTGLGTSTLGLARFCARHGIAARLEVDAVDRDAGALALMQVLCARAASLGGTPITLRSHARELASLDSAVLRPPYDVVLLGLVLGELAAGADEVARATGHVAQLRRVVPLAAPDGVLVVLEPALRASSRVLHRVRDAFARTDGPPYVFAPCVRRGDCPMLARPRDWCHEALALDLPPALARLAHAAGLREHELSYSYLTLHVQPRSLRERAPQPILRVVGGPLRSKGKIEAYVCGDASVHKLRELDRHTRRAERRLEPVGRGDLLVVDGVGEERGDVWVLGPATGVRVVK